MPGAGARRCPYPSLWAPARAGHQAPVPSGALRCQLMGLAPTVQFLVTGHPASLPGAVASQALASLAPIPGVELGQRIPCCYSSGKKRAMFCRAAGLAAVGAPLPCGEVNIL